MEIYNCYDNVDSVTWFKIDLIVWKSDTEEEAPANLTEFKIDLIVWK